jgi:DNA-binding transcriptional regulator YdaS (Cro superfamily)
MDMLEYISDPDRRADLVAKLKTSPLYLRQIATRFRNRTCSPKLAIRIEEASGGQITRESLRPDIWEPRGRRKRAA